MTFKQRLEEVERVSLSNTWGKKETIKCKGPRQECAWHVPGTARGSLWLEWSEQRWRLIRRGRRAKPERILGVILRTFILLSVKQKATALFGGRGVTCLIFIFKGLLYWVRILKEENRNRIKGTTRMQLWDDHSSFWVQAAAGWAEWDFLMDFM